MGERKRIEEEKKAKIIGRFTHHNDGSGTQPRKLLDLLADAEVVEGGEVEEVLGAGRPHGLLLAGHVDADDAEAHGARREARGHGAEPPAGPRHHDPLPRGRAALAQRRVRRHARAEHRRR